MVPAGMAWLCVSSLSLNTQPERSAAVLPALKSSTQSPGVPPLDSISLILMLGSTGAASAGTAVSGAPASGAEPEHRTAVIAVSVQSVSVTVRVTVTGPGAAQVNETFAPALVTFPEVALHW